MAVLHDGWAIWRKCNVAALEDEWPWEELKIEPEAKEVGSLSSETTPHRQLFQMATKAGECLLCAFLGTMELSNIWSNYCLIAIDDVYYCIVLSPRPSLHTDTLSANLSHSSRKATKSKLSLVMLIFSWGVLETCRSTLRANTLLCDALIKDKLL